MSRTQEIEKYYYKKFAAAFGLPEIYEIKDKPDIRITQDHKNIGIEITNFYLKDGSDISSEQRQSPIRKRVVEKAQNLYEKHLNRGIEVSFGFNTIENEQGLSKNIADWLATQNFTSSDSLSPFDYKHIPELRFVYVNIGPYEDAEWKISQCYSVSNTSPEELQKIILEKEKKVDGYNKEIDETWLLIVIDFINSGMDQEPANVDYSDISVTEFDKVILYKTGYESIIEFPKKTKSS